MEVTYPDEWYISGRWVLHIWTSVTYLDHGSYIFGRVLHIWAMGVTHLEDCYISGRQLYICTPQWKKPHQFPQIFWVVYMRTIFVFWLEMIVSANIFRRHNPIRIYCMHNKHDKYSQSNCYPGCIGSTCCSADWGLRHITSWTPNVMADWIFTCALSEFKQIPDQIVFASS